MFDKLSCILCLEKGSPFSGQINIDSEELQSVKVSEFIEKHFKEELRMLAYFSNTTKVVCNQCWELVQSFHEFYVRVRNAHLAASNTLKSLQELEIAITEIKTETGTIDKLASPPTRKRGRLRLQKTTEDSSDRQPIALKECSVRVEQLTFPYCNSSKDSQKDKNKINGYIKIGTIPGEKTDLNYLHKLSYVDSGLKNPIPPKYEDVLEQSLPLKKVCSKKKVKRKLTNQKIEPKQTKNASHRTSEDQDEFIAQHFKLACILCQKSLIDFRELKIHYRKQHQTKGYVKCCGKKLLYRGVLVDHIHVHNNPEYFKCEHCGKLMSDRRGLETHIQFFHGSRERIYHCDICSKRFFRREVLARHYLIHAPDEEKIVKCTQCEKTFCNEYNMKQHLKMVHLHSYAKICDICGKSFHSGEAFRRHQEEHSGLPKSLIKCKLCDSELTTKYVLARHMKVMHTEKYQKPQVCPICSKVSPTLRAHHTHFKYMHATEKKHVCKLCDKAFKRPSRLREHMTTHTGEVLYTCTFCPQTFNSNANMYAHRKRKHPKEWTEKCTKKRGSTGTGQLIQKILVSVIESADAEESK